MSTLSPLKTRAARRHRTHLARMRLSLPSGNTLLKFSAVVNVVAIIGVAALLVHARIAPPAPPLPPSAIPASEAVRPLNAPVGKSPEGFYYKGSPDAPVKVVEYSDFQCPACSSFFQRLEGQIDQRYIETGKVQWIYRDLPLRIPPNAIPAAEAARCAGDQNKYWPMHNLLLSRQREWQDDRDLTPRMVSYAGELGLDRAAFKRCLADDRHLPALQQADATARQNGIDATPSFVVDGRRVKANELPGAIDAALQAKEQGR